MEETKIRSHGLWMYEFAERVEIGENPSTDNRCQNYGRCHICGSEHLLAEDGAQCGKG